MKIDSLNTFDELARRSLDGQFLDADEAYRLLCDESLDLLGLLGAAYTVRRHHWGKKVRVHILNNVQNGHCPEDCSYCAQGKKSNAGAIEDYPMKNDEEILDEARRAHEAGAFRYCMVFAGRGPSDKRTERLAHLVRTIKERYPIEVCVSTGILKEGQAETLKQAGLDRLNHNLNTTRENYPNICSTHTFEDRLRTLRYARAAGLESCSGMILGMGEGRRGVVEILFELAAQKVRSIPINFLLSLDGTTVGTPEKLTPEYCLRVLCLARLTNPAAEIRAAAGRELHLRSLQPLALYPANSLFMDGYLNVMGEAQRQTLQMIQDAGFEIESESGAPFEETSSKIQPAMKGRAELHPTR